MAFARDNARGTARGSGSGNRVWNQNRKPMNGAWQKNRNRNVASQRNRNIWDRDRRGGLDQRDGFRGQGRNQGNWSQGNRAGWVRCNNLPPGIARQNGCPPNFRGMSNRGQNDRYWFDGSRGRDRDWQDDRWRDRNPRDNDAWRYSRNVRYR
ncbi:MAG: hypothetical protein AB7O65_01210 [Candidatus Korobacteraceae bacterium]